jgi:transcriptional regulator with XRE-family HTH domain
VNKDATEQGGALRIARESAGISLAGMAKRTSYSKSYLGLVETGRKRASPTVLLAYERVLGRDLMDRRGLVTGVAATLVAPAAATELLRAGFEAVIAGRRTIEEWLHRVETYGQD